MDYVNGGVWSEKAAKEAGKWAQVHQPAGSMDTEAGLSYPPAEQWWVAPAATPVELAVSGILEQHGGLLRKPPFDAASSV